MRRNPGGYDATLVGDCRIVERYLGDGKFQAVEGNTSVSNKSNGGEVQRALRHLTQVDGFGRVT